MENKYFPNLAKSITINGLTFKNRILGAPMSNPEMDVESKMRKEDIAFHQYRVSGGVSSVCIGLGVVEAIGRTHTKEVTLYDRMSLPSLKKFADAIHMKNANAVMELTHGGRYANARGHGGEEEAGSVGPNDEVNSAGNKVRAMTEDDIQRIANAFGTSAALCKEAGIDMILIHAGHGWLLHQFISGQMNKRTDQYGGSLENRMRFPLLCLQKVREAVGPNYPIEVRMSGAEFSDGGYGIEEGIEIAKMFDGKVDIIHVSAGVHENPKVFGITHPTMFIENGCNVHLAAEVKKHVKTPVATLGGLNDVDMMEDIIASGKADIVEVARQSICDPYFVEKAFRGEKDDINKCCRCFTCFYNYLSNRTYACAFNPEVGYELESNSAPLPTTPKKVIVVGGGVGGMQAAITASKRGHSVELYEKTDKLGGQLLSEEHMPFKKDMFNFVGVLERRLKKTNVKIHMNKALTGEEAAKMNADVIMVAVGATFAIPPIKGIDGSNVVTIDKLHNAPSSVGQKVVILGGGLVGSEMAVHLDMQGKEVTLVEMMGRWANDASFMHRDAMEIYFNEKSKVQIHVSTKAKEITDKGMVCIGKDGKEFTVEADTVLLAAGMKSNRDVVEGFYNAAPRVFEVGDAIKPSCAGQSFLYHRPRKFKLFLIS